MKSNIGISTRQMTGNYPEYSEAKDRGMIEEGIRPLCDALLALGANPLASCSGHYQGMANGRIDRFRLFFLGEQASWSKPYVLFTATTTIARSINGYLMHDKGLTFNWQISGQFDVENELCWLFEPNDWRISCYSRWSHKGKANSEKLVATDIRIIARKLAI